ncbi:MAG: hypothetical protein K6G45_02110 [Lachnospiraceae bacterium]|nr:hypothetical protein [Lachnospiraceae bacterium]
MNEPENTLQDKLKENSKVEVVVKREDSEEAGELDLVRVFSNMGRKRRIYAWIIIACLLIGLATPLLMAELAEKHESVSTVITFLYPQAAYQKAPDESDLDMNYVKSSYIIQKALDRSKLSIKIPISAVERNISIESMLSENTRQRLEVAQKMTDESKNYTDVLNIPYIYEGRYIVTLTNGFSTDPEAKKKTYLNGTELSNLLNGIVTAYNEYFHETYSKFTLPDNTKASYASESMDYIERLDGMVELLDNLSKYCTDKEKEDFLEYRSLKDGLTLLDINKCIKLVKDIDVDYLYAYVYFNSISKDPTSMVTKYAYTLRTTQTELDQINESIKDNANLIAEYKNKSILVSLGEQGTNQLSTTVTDYYNELIKTQAQHFEDKAGLNEKIANLNDKIEGFNKASSRSTQVKYVNDELASLTLVCDALYDMVEAHADEIVNSDSYKNLYMDYIGAQFINTSFFSASTIKKTVIGGVVGLFLGIFIWGMDGLIEEFKRGSKESKEKAAQKAAAKAENTEGGANNE